MSFDRRPPPRDGRGPRPNEKRVYPKIAPLPDDDRRLILGLQAVREALRVRGKDLEVWVDGSFSAELDALARFATDQGAVVKRQPRDILDRHARGGRHQGVLAYAPELTLASLEDLTVEKGDVFIALDELEDPQNFGAIIRSSVALGAKAVLWPEHHSAPLTPATFRASAGAVEHAKLVRVPALPEALGVLKSKGAFVVGLDANGTTSAGALPSDAAIVLVVGAEGKGLRKPVKQACDALLRLTMKGPIASLNASVAAGIGLYVVLGSRAGTGSGEASPEASTTPEAPVFEAESTVEPISEK